MKTKLFTLLLAVAASIGTILAWDYERVQIGDLYYNLDVAKKTAEVAKNNSANGDIVIPASVTYNSVTYSVTSIGNSAFSYCKKLTSITIPNSVTSIGDYAFSGCTGLTSPVYNVHVFAYMPISYSGAYTIPDGIESIAGRAFYQCTGLTSVTIPNSVTSIGDYAFSGCTGLTSPVYNAHVFAYMPTSYSGAYTIPDGIESIASYAFEGCTGLTSVTIPNSVTNIGIYAFGGCSGLNLPVYNAHVFAYLPTSYSGAYTIPDGIESIVSYAFEGCTGLTSVTIPNSVTSIEAGAFYGCSDLISVTIPNSVTSIEAGAFYGCRSLTSVSIPNSVTSIRYGVFYNCTGLISVTIPNSVTSIGGDAFYNCSGLTSVTIPNSVTSIGDYAFYGCSGLTKVNITDIAAWCKIIFATYDSNPLYYAKHLYINNVEVTELVIPNSVTRIENSAFSSCRSLTSVIIQNSVTSIGDEAFSGCTGLTSVAIPNSVTSIGKSAFRYCSGLTSIAIGNSVTSIGNNAFSGCSSLTDIYATCGDLERVKQLFNNDSRVKYAPLKYSITCNVNIREAGRVQIPENECEDVVISAIPNYGYHFTQWSDGNTNNPRTIVWTQDTTFTAEFGIDKSGTCGENNALMWTYDDISKTLTITGNGTLNSNYTFGIEAPTQMQTLIIGDQVTAVGNYAFNSRTTIQKIVIGSNVTSIGDYAFADINNRQLANLVMPAELLTIGDYAFSGNTYLESIDFNAKLQSIGAYAFNNCFRVSEMTCLATITPDLGTDALASINSIASLCVPAECLRKYQIDPNWGRFALCELGASSTTTDQNVTVIPNENSAIVTWPTSNNAATYTLQITKDGVVFCTLIFNGAGQLIGISFAPSRDGSSHAPAATVSVAGMSFTVTCLSSASKYAYNLSVADDNNQEIVYYQGEFATTGYEGEVVPGGEPVTPGGGTTVIDNVHPSTQSVGTTKFFRNGQLLILRGNELFNAQGARVE